MQKPIIIEPETNPIAAAIWLHGLGADGNDFVPVIPQLNLPKSMPIRFIFPHAPIRPITINNGIEMRGWYDISSMNFEHYQEDKAGIEESKKIIDTLIEEQAQQGIPYNQIFLIGFSQGGALSLQTGLRFQHQLGGMIILSAYLPLAATLLLERTEANITTPIMMAHGVQDGIIPIIFAQKSREFLLHAGYTVDFHEYAELAHQVCAREIQDMSQWLQARI